MNLELRHLQLVYQLAQTKNVTRAADRLSLSQPAASRQLQRLEELAGAELFQRSGRSLEITPAGERVLETAERVLDLLTQTEQDLAVLKRTESAKVRLTTECYTMYRWLPLAMEEFHDKHPGVPSRHQHIRFDRSRTRAPRRPRRCRPDGLTGRRSRLACHPAVPRRTRRRATPDARTGGAKGFRAQGLRRSASDRVRCAEQRHHQWSASTRGHPPRSGLLRSNHGRHPRSRRSRSGDLRSGPLGRGRSTCAGKNRHRSGHRRWLPPAVECRYASRRLGPAPSLVRDTAQVARQAISSLADTAHESAV